MFDAANASLRMTAGTVNIGQSIDLLLSTLRGSRPLLPEFGSSLRRFVFQRADAQMLEELSSAVRFVLLHGEPRIVVESVSAEKRDDEGVLELRIAYQVSQTNTRYNHVYPFACLEGNNLTPLSRRPGS